MIHISKYPFHLSQFRFASGERLDVSIGYETYGTLNEQRDNAILICHFWTGTSHAAGRYQPDDPMPGWWDGLIGPGKPIDTDRFFVICSDTLANVQAFDPMVISTGPASLDPGTGRPFGSRFPTVTFRDIVRVQRGLIAHLGISHLYAVGGPSGGGMQALEWACTYPEMVQRVFGVSTFGRSNAFFTQGIYRWCRALITNDPYWQGGDYYAGPGPQVGLRQALGLITMMAQTPTRVNAVAQSSEMGWDIREGAAPFTDPDAPFPYEVGFNAFVDGRARFADANAFLAIARAAVLLNVGHGRGGFAQALAGLRARLLLIPCAQDMYFPPSDSQDVVTAVQAAGGQAELYPINSDWGHFACLFDTDRYAHRLHDFLAV